MASHPVPVTLALQSGGAHSAFAWGAIDQLLLSEAVKVEAVTAASGGAVCAVILADGMLRGGPDEGRAHLAAFWKKVSVAAGMLPIRPHVVDKFLSDVGIDFSPGAVALDYLTKLFSPYQFNLFDLNPLRGIVEEMVDFEAIRAQKALSLYINATHAKTGESRVFRESELTIDMVMASCCLPFIFRTVEVEGVPYWDGAFSGNPAIYPLLNEKKERDLLLISTTPSRVEEVPTHAADILDRTTEISFASALLHDLRELELHNREHPEQSVRLHRIEDEELLSGAGRASKLNADWDFLVYLHDLGAQAASDWLEKGFSSLGGKPEASLARRRNS